eukprot:NODE_71_length_23666_cov_0.239403.p1 type:complete len:920 gc:universal NODE_71_length_23666_cov_0.239403:23160-20401(-)
MPYDIQFTNKKGKTKWKDGKIEYVNKKYVVRDTDGDWICANAKITGDITDKGTISFYYIRTEDPELIAKVNNKEEEITENENEVEEAAPIEFDYVILYSTQLQKKVKNYSDGFLCVNGEHAVLYNESKQKICRDGVANRTIEIGKEFKMKNTYAIYVDQAYTQQVKCSPNLILNVKSSAIERKSSFKPFKTPYKNTTTKAEGPTPENTESVSFPMIPLRSTSNDCDLMELLLSENEHAPTQLSTEKKRHSTPSDIITKKRKIELTSLDGLEAQSSHFQIFRKCQLNDKYTNREDYLNGILMELYENIQISTNLQLENCIKLQNDNKVNDSLHKATLSRRFNGHSDTPQLILSLPKNTDMVQNELWVLSKGTNFKNYYFVKSENRIFGNNRKTSECNVVAVGSHNLEKLDEMFQDSNSHSLLALRLGFHFDLNLISILKSSDFGYTGICHYLATGEYTEALNVPWHLDWLVEYELLEASSHVDLNKNQVRLLHTIAKAVFEPTEIPIVLCHGFYGCGKSFIIAMSIMLLINTINSDKSDCDDFKILIAANTNTAVDRVLLILIKLGFTDFVRVGSITKIHRDVLPYSVSSNKDDCQKANKLAAEMANSEQELELLNDLYKTMIEKDALSCILNSKVVATTCHSTTLNCLKSVDFPVVFLDESSQMTEPVSLLPLRFECKRVVCFGDPKQLPPTIETKSDTTCIKGLDRTLFERVASWIDPVVLQTQYRCHSAISELSSRLFYNNTVINGQSVGSCLTDVDPLLLINCQGQEEYIHGSSRNTMEAKFIVDCIIKIRKFNISLNEIGIITPFRAQVEEINKLLLQLGADYSKLQVSTIDAFQGGEKSIIFASLVKSRNIARSTFMNDKRRVNVLITRAKSHLFLCGQLSSFTTPLWKSIALNINKKNSDEFKLMLDALISKK